MHPREAIPYAWSDKGQTKNRLVVRVGGKEDKITFDKAKKEKKIGQYKIDVRIIGNSKRLKIKLDDQTRRTKAIK